MQRPSTQAKSQFAGTDRFLYLTLVAASVLLAAVVAVLPVEYVLPITALAVGLLLLGLVVDRPTRRLGVVLLLSLVPLVGILKAIAGSRFAPFVFDMGIFFACAVYMLDRTLRAKGRLAIIDALMGAFLGLALIQIANPNVPSLQAGTEGFRKFAFIGIAFYVGRHIFRDQDWRLVQRLLIGISLLIAVYGIKQFFLISPLDYRIIDLATASPITYFMGGQLRPFSTLPGPFHLGLYLIVSMLLVLRLAMRPQTRLRQRWLLMLVFGIQLIALFLTRTKSNWLGLAVGIVILVILQRGAMLGKVRRLLWVALVTGVALVLILALIPGDAVPVLRDAVDAVLNISDAPTVRIRQDLWRETIIPAVSENPLIGYGTSSAGEGLSNLYEGTSALYFSSHSLYFKIILEMGALGFVLFAALILISFQRARRSLRNPDLHSMEAVAVLPWSISVVIAFLVAGLTVPVLDAYPSNYYFWLLLGVMSRPLEQAA